MASDAPTHAFANQECSCAAMFLARFDKGFAMDCDKFGQRIRPLSTLPHVVIFEGLDVPDLGQTLFPVFHPGMRRRRPCAGSKQDQGFHLWEAGVRRARLPVNLALSKRSGKEPWQDVGNKVHQAVADHVGGEVATPQIESGQDCARGECDKNIGRAS